MDRKLNCSEGFTGLWIPREIREDGRLNMTEKCLLAQITALDNEDGCFASNAYLSETMGCSVSTVTNGIRKLKSLGLIEVTNFDGRTRTLRTCITASDSQDDKICESGSQTADDRSLLNKTKNKTKRISKREKRKRNGPKRFVPPTLDEIEAYCYEINSSVDAASFCDHYTSNGWMVGSSPMVDWKAALRRWEKNGIDRFRRDRKKKHDDDDELSPEMMAWQLTDPSL
ncbi:MAG: helix-turn-helix domain-containing protein [Ruminococcus sp.]|nr:helix-turn-helix domain-containing protein [Ruminococcus sp.]